MSNKISPLRYPGGKAKIYNNIKKIFEKNKLKKIVYCEPFAGGCGLALLLLKNHLVEELILNDYDRGIFSFWYSILNYNNEFIEMIRNIEISIEEREKQKNIYLEKEKIDIKNYKEVLKLGLATFYLNRVNRSGILKAGVIGGKKQNGAYKMNCRFNKEKLILQIQEIYKYRKKIKFYNLDVLDFLKLINKRENLFIFFDPPYYNKGSELYTNFFKHDDHLKLAKEIKKITNNWIVTYDNSEEIKKMYNTHDILEFDINYSLQNKIKGKEIIIFSSKLIKDF